MSLLGFRQEVTRSVLDESICLDFVNWQDQLGRRQYLGKRLGYDKTGRRRSHCGSRLLIVFFTVGRNDALGVRNRTLKFCTTDRRRP